MADFKLGRIKFKWRGDWSTSTGFLIDDVVKYGGNTYVCIVNHTSQSTSPGFYTDLSAAKWSLQAESLFFKGTYAASTHYKLNDVVKYGARQFRCTTQHTSAATVGGVAILNAANFELYIDATDYKGTYTTSTYYKVNDVVKYGASLWICTTAHTSSASASAFDETKFSTYTEGLQFEDTWTSGAYQKGDVVTYGGYAYIANQEISAGGSAPVASTVSELSSWDLIVPGFKSQGTYSDSTPYKTGDTIQFGGWAYVCIVNTTAGQNPYTHSAKWQTINEGFKWNGEYSSITTYYKGDVVSRAASSYIAIQHNILNVTPGSDASKWQVLAEGDQSAVLTTRGDIQIRNSSTAARLPIGPIGAQLTSTGLDPVWKNPTNRNILYVANDGSDSNPGTELLPFKTIKYALTQCGKGDVTDFDTSTISGGTGGTPGEYDVTGSGGSGTGFTARVTIDGSSTPIIDITNGGKDYTTGNTITISNSQIGGTPATNITFTVKSVNAGDVLYVRNGVFREQLPIVCPQFVTIRGDSLRSTEIRPATGESSSVATVTRTSGGVTGKTAGTYTYVKQLSTSGSGVGIRIKVIQDGSSNPVISVVHGGYGYIVGDSITFSSASVGSTDNLVLTVATRENNDASYVFLCNNGTNIEYLAFRGFTGLQTHSAQTYAGGHGAVITSLDPEGLITNTSPYIQNCTSFSNNSVGIKIDGLLHDPVTSNRSILANDFTQINSDGIGVWALGGGRGEMVSVFTYYCQKSFYTSGGGFLRGLNCSSAYGEQGIVAEGELAAEVPTVVKSRGRTISYNPLTVSGAGASEFAIGQTLVGATSGATGTIFRLNTQVNKLHLDPATGFFQQGELVTVTRLSAGTFTFNTPNTAAGISGNGAKQSGFFIEVESTDGTLAVSNPIKLGDNVKIGNSTTYYIVSGFTNQDTSAQTATVRLVSEVSTLDAYPDQTTISFTRKYSNCRFTGHDFLDIGTGGFTDTNYPNTPLQAADQADEVEFNTGGRVYWTSSDQGGDFRVGDLFRIQQATGIATLNADAFDLSGLTELQLGSIGAQLGATINEFSTDEAMSGNSSLAVPTENAIVGYIQRDNMGTGIFVPPTGTTAERPTSGYGLYSGGLRFNTDIGSWEGYNGVQWTGIGGGNPWTTLTADGSTIFLAAANDRYFVNTTAAACTINLPAAPLTGDQIRFIDVAGTFDTNNLTIGRNSLKIMGLTENLIISTENAGIGLVYSGSTNGWRIIENA
jgi:hypothetical protein